MSKFNEWQQTKQQLSAAKSWVSNRLQLDSQDGKLYTKVKLQSVKFEYCGQAYAGANNYHEAPKEFQKYIALAINEMRTEIEDLALKKLSADNDECAINAKSEVESMLLDINSTEGDGE
ncbi:MAG: hypothetical protein COA43_14645 [Robiginitomaculum sp.]|nr:MAG: hypothetical protein COA43_14645 [Robiginitomaculum sp.]